MKNTWILRLMAICMAVSGLATGCATTHSSQQAIWSGWQIEKPRQSPSSSTQLAIEKLARGSLNEAEDALRRAIAEAPKAADLCLYAEIAALRGDFKTAMARYISAYNRQDLGDFEAIVLARLMMISAQTVTPLPWDEIKQWRAIHPYSMARLVTLQNRAIRQNQITEFYSANGAIPLTQFKWVGPFSPYPYAEFDDPMPFDGDLRLKDAYDIDDANAQLTSFRYAPGVQTPMPASKQGIYAGETVVEVANPGSYLIVVEANQYYALSVDNSELLRRGPEQTGKDQLLAVELKLDKGMHSIRIKLGLQPNSNNNSPVLAWMIPVKVDKSKESSNQDRASIAEISDDEAARGGMATSSAAPELVGKVVDIDSVIATRQGDGAIYGFDPSNALMAWYGAALAIADGHAEKADAILHSRLEKAPDDVVAQYWRALRYRYDADLATSLRHEKAMHIWHELVEKAPEITAVASAMIAEMIQQNQPKEARLLWNTHRSQLPNTADTALLESRVAQTLDWSGFSEKRIKDAAKLEPNSCSTVSLAIKNATNRHQYTAFEDLSPQARRCPAVIRSYAQREGDDNANATDKWTKALATLAKAYPNDERLKVSTLLMRAESGDPNVTSQIIDFLDEVKRGIYREPDTESLLAIVDTLRAKNKTDDARRILAKLVDLMPNDEMIQNLAWQIDSKRPLEHLRKDGIATIRAYLAARQNAPEPEAGASTLILDYAAMQIAPNGAKLGLTHTISRVLSKEGKNAVGEVYLPNSATVLKVRTIKGDTLETIEPESIDFKSSITAPNLAVGDFVETEYITYEPPISAYASRAVSDAFFFASDQTPILHSEFVVEYPSAWNAKIVEAGPAGNIERSCTSRGESTTCTFLRKNSPAFVTEPNAPTEFDLIPNIHLYYAWGWPEIKRALRESIARQTRQTPYIQAYVDQIKFDNDESSSWKKAQIAYDFVLNSIRESDATHTSDSDSATQTITRGSGSRLITLKAIYDALGLTNYFAFIRAVGAPQQSANLPAQYESFYGTLLVVETEKGPAYVDGSEDFIPFDYLPTSFQGQSVIPIDDKIEPFTSRRDDIASMQPTIEIAYEIDESGAATAKASETMRGGRGLSMRGFLTSLKGDDTRTHLIIENSLARNYGRIHLTNLAIDALDDHNAPLTLHYDFDIASFAATDGNMLDINSNIFAYKLVDQFAKLPASTRKYPVIIGGDVLSSRTLSLKAPEGYTWNAQTLHDVDIDTPFGKFSRKLTLDGDKLQLRESIELLSQRIETAQYADFRNFCLAVDEAQRTMIRAQRNE